MANGNLRASWQSYYDGLSQSHETRAGGQYSNSILNLNTAQIRTQTYYDDYNWDGLNSLNFDAATSLVPIYANARGLPTGAATYHGTDGQTRYRAMYYDNKGRTIQSRQHNDRGQVEQTDTQYNFVGQPLKMRQLFVPPLGNAITNLTEYTYDHVGRKTACKLDLGNISNQTIANYQYDETGRLKRKVLLPDGTFGMGGMKDYITRPVPDGIVSQPTQDVARKAITLLPNTTINPQTVGSYVARIDPNATGGASINGLQKIDYNWHIRGALRGINLDGGQNPIPNSNEADLFSYKLDYETAGFYDGNIGKQTWNSGTTQRNYTYNYDAASRLKSAIYSGTNGEDYSIPNMSYDRNGNITNLQRRGKITPSGGWGLMDNFSYGYNGNRLTQITDGISGDNEVDFVQKGRANYSFYDDGSLKSDANEQIQNIIYDSYLQQPTQVQLTDGRTINHFYAGTGKLLKTVYSTGEVWEFGDGGLVYKNGLPYQVSTPEGRVIYQNGSWQNEFAYTDHLGNTRVSFKANGSQLEKVAETAFDPWGVVLNGLGLQNATQNRWEMQGKESEKTFGLNRINFGARTYNPTSVVWDRVDVKSEKYYQISPFAYTLNNPLRFFDPNGKEIVDSQGKKVTFKVEKDQSITWSKNATADIIKIGGAMAKTKVGLKILNDLNKSKTKVGIEISQESRINESGKTVFGFTQPNVSKDGKQIESAKMTIYEGSFKQFEGKAFGFKKLGEVIRADKFSTDDNMGATAVHEGVHIIDKSSSRALNPGKSYDLYEQKPREAEVLHYKQLENKEDIK